MTTIGFVNNKGGAGKTTLVYHLGHMLVDKGHRVLLVDLDPQSHLTEMCLPEERLAALWQAAPGRADTILGAVQPSFDGTPDVSPHTESIREGLALLPGDARLYALEDQLASAWVRALEGDEAALRVLSAFSRVVRQAAESEAATIVLVDVGPTLGAINRSALLACDGVIMPLGPDLFSSLGLRLLGPSLGQWRQGWRERLLRSPAGGAGQSTGAMRPLGYVLMQTGMRLSRPASAYQSWAARLPSEYSASILHRTAPAADLPADPQTDPWCLGVMRHYQSLMPLAQDARKPMFHLRPADGATGAHLQAVQRCREDFDTLATRVLSQIHERITEATP
jgi:chromosome partitioning protein